ncbi:MAG: hypothetical protein JWN85_3530 [Gammaproteobacteria bacterium]|nr:hypothetical protein [Gammaproteobacteria bacterium]
MLRQAQPVAAIGINSYATQLWLTLIFTLLPCARL